MKLGDDAQRHTPRSCSATANPESAAGDQHRDSTASAPGGPASMWQRAFHQEAMQCVEQMRAVVDNASVNNFASRFEDWRKVDLKATAQLQHHVKELTRINNDAEQFLKGCTSTQDLSSFRHLLGGLSERADQLCAAKDALVSNADDIAQRSFEKAVAAWRREGLDVTEMLRGHTRDQREHWAIEEQRWSGLDTKVEQLQQVVGVLTQTVHLSTQSVGHLERATKESSKDISDALQLSAQDAKSEARRTVEQIMEEVRKGLATDVDSLRTQLKYDFSDEGSAGARIVHLGDSMRDLQKVAEEEMKYWRDQAESLKKDVASLQTATERAKELQDLMVKSEGQVAELGGKVKRLDKDLERTKALLVTAQNNSVVSGLTRLQEVEQRGNVKMDRSTGVVTVLAPLEFVEEKKPSKEPPEQQLTDPEAAEKIFADIAAVAGIFQGPVELEVQIKPGKGGAPAYWDQLSKGRAELANAGVLKLGVPADKLTTSGITIKQGSSGLVMRLDKALFSAGGGDKGGAKRAASPKRK